MPAAERSLARTASIAEPSELVRSRATPNATTTQHDQAHEPELQAREVLPGTDAEVDAEQLRLPDACCRRSSTMSVLRNQIASMAKASAKRDDAEGQAPQPQRGEADEDADDRRGGRGEERRDRERHAPVAVR